jgi:hypothetical protein
MSPKLYVVKDVAISASGRARINGRGIRRRKLDARQRSCRAAQAILREKQLDLSVRQIAEIFGVSVPYIMTALELSPAKREAIATGKDGTSFGWLTMLKPSPKPAKATA